MNVTIEVSKFPIAPLANVSNVIVRISISNDGKDYSLEIQVLYSISEE